MSQQDEKIGVRRIKVIHPGLRATAVVGSFFAVDTLLLGWAARLNGALDCRFEIEYHDGRMISGAYRFRRKGCSRPALMHFVRASVQALCEGAAQTCALDGLANRPHAFLEVYETDDFALA